MVRTRSWDWAERQLLADVSKSRELYKLANSADKIKKGGSHMCNGCSLKASIMPHSLGLSRQPTGSWPGRAEFFTEKSGSYHPGGPAYVRSPTFAQRVQRKRWKTRSPDIPANTIRTLRLRAAPAIHGCTEWSASFSSPPRRTCLHRITGECLPKLFCTLFRDVTPVLIELQ